jgi:hypothetical protein
MRNLRRYRLGTLKVRLVKSRRRVRISTNGSALRIIPGRVLQINIIGVLIS